MVNIFGRSDQQKGLGSPRGEVGEIDTRAPFQSVKAAVSLFGEVALSRGKTMVKSKSKLSSENILHKETQLLLAQKEVNKYKKQLEGDEATIKRAKTDLETAKRTLNDLTTKLKAVSECKQAAMEAADAIKKLANQLEAAKSQKGLGSSARMQELDLTIEQYKKAANEIDIAKQQLTEMRQDFDAALEAKWAAFQRAAEAQRSANMNTERVNELSKEIKAMRESAQQVKIAAAESHEQQARIVAVKDARIRDCKIGTEEMRKTIEVLKKGYEPDDIRHLESKLAEVTAEINCRDKVTILQWELENLKGEQAELQKKAAEKESVDEEKGHASDDHSLTLRRLESEAEKSRQEAENMKQKARELQQETENANSVAEEAEEKLKLLLVEAEKAKAEEKRVRDEMQSWSERTKIREPDSRNIRVSMEEYTSMKRKVEELEDMTKTKEADVKAQLEAINARQVEAAKQLETSLKAIEEIQQATEIALKSAEMAEAAQNAIEAELLKWRQQDEVTIS